jgi:hypothetical protein
MRNSIALFGAAAAVLLLPSACNHDRLGQTTVSGAVILPSEDAVFQLTARRCEREFDCNNIGAGKRYEDNAACEREVSHDLQSELRPANCTYGVRGDKLDECLQELRNEKCGNPLDTVSRLATCRTGRICLR